MKTITNQIINRVFAAVCGFQIVKGGGGGGYNSLKGACIRGFSALSAAVFSATIQKIIIAAAVFFAAGFTTSANAQVGVDTPAMAEVWTKPGYTRTVGDTTIDFDMTIPEIYMKRDEENYMPAVQFAFIAGTTAGEECPSVGLCYLLDGMTVFFKAGDSVELGQFDHPRNVITPPTVRIYTTNPGGELAFAQYSGTVGVAESGEFYLDDNWEETDIAAARGFVPAVCDTDSGYELQPDMTSCLIPATCGDNAERNSDDITMCVCNSGHQFVADSTTTCEPIPATCGNNATNDPDDMTMCVCDADHRFVADSTTTCEPISQDGNTETQPPQTQNPTTQTPQNRADNKERRVKSINTATGLLAVGVIAVFLAGGVPSFNMSPDFGYRITESGYSANVGGRADFRKDNWHLYYFANQTNANGEFEDFRYESGGKYTADFWTATFSESVSGETADYNFSLSANLQNRIWKISPVYRLHSEYEKGETETQNELNLQGNFRYNRWTILPSAGFRWENANDFSENARFQINAIHRF